ncbi:nucleoside-binding protein [Planctobacterium marinum]|uniref:nucleoside-binding protein n=1 Tax=Planctobacterium marinum TaxID=1631968 RepID=UPI001E34D7A6|nr:nucleoside-binding protein [Planctobacterium marinum]MCC2605735.1 nucleoside-binding protein [Planctobacterium marinum]
MFKRFFIACFYLGLISSINIHASEWSVNEIHITHGELNNPFSDSFASSSTTIITYQHVSGWEYGDSFIMVDYIDDDNNDGFNDDDFYHESYFNFSSNKIFDIDYGNGPLSDVGMFLGVNIAGRAKVKKFLPGIRLSWDVPGFSFLNTDAGGYIDHSAGSLKGGAPKEENSAYFDVSWGYPFTLGNQKFSLEGHIEYITGRDVLVDGDSKVRAHDWLLIQPQLRWDVGHALYNKPDQFFIGFEFQYWKNKLGGNKSEREAQFLAVWRM